MQRKLRPTFPQIQTLTKNALFLPFLFFSRNKLRNLNPNLPVILPLLPVRRKPNPIAGGGPPILCLALFSHFCPSDLSLLQRSCSPVALLLIEFPYFFTLFCFCWVPSVCSLHYLFCSFCKILHFFLSLSLSTDSSRA